MNKIIPIVATSALVLGGGYYVIHQRQVNNEKNLVNTPVVEQVVEQPSQPAAVETKTVSNKKILPAVETWKVYPGQTGAEINGKLWANGLSVTWWFEYGQTTSLGNQTPPTDRKAFFGTFVFIGKQIKELEKGLTYYYRAVAKNQNGTVYGKILNFKTRP